MARGRKKQESQTINFLAAADAISKDKGIDREEICVLVEQALASAYKKSSKNNYDLTVNIDRVTGEIKASYSKTIFPSAFAPVICAVVRPVTLGLVTKLSYPIAGIPGALSES